MITFQIVSRLPFQHFSLILSDEVFSIIAISELPLEKKQHRLIDREKMAGKQLTVEKSS